MVFRTPLIDRETALFLHLEVFIPAVQRDFVP